MGQGKQVVAQADRPLHLNEGPVERLVGERRVGRRQGGLNECDDRRHQVVEFVGGHPGQAAEQRQALAGDQLVLGRLQRRPELLVGLGCSHRERRHGPTRAARGQRRRVVFAHTNTCCTAFAPG